MSDPVSPLLDELRKARDADALAAAIPTEMAQAVYYAIEERFGYTSAMWDRPAVENMAGRPLTNDEWSQVTKSEWWDNTIADIAYDAVRDASTISLMLADLDIL